MTSIAVVNAGSGSLRISLFRLHPADAPGKLANATWEAYLESTGPGTGDGRLHVRIRQSGRPEVSYSMDADLTIRQRIADLFRMLWEGSDPPLREPGELALVAHRIVHGGTRFLQATVVNPTVESEIERLGQLAPMHQPANLAGIRAARTLCPSEVPQVAVFDTAFHRTLPPAALTYAGPVEWLGAGIRRYGFHGSSFRWAAERSAVVLGRIGDPDLSLIVCHLGGGCSLCATRGGRSQDTTMGFTPLEGIAMSTRSGTIDPGIIFHLVRQGADPDEIERVLCRESGLKGLSGISGDTRILRQSIAEGHSQARLAMDVFIHRLRSGIGQMLAALGARPHAIIFTGSMGEEDASVRAAACEPFGFLGLHIEPELNRAAHGDAEISGLSSEVRAWVIEAREAWQIARESLAAVAVQPAWSLSNKAIAARMHRKHKENYSPPDG